MVEGSDTQEIHPMIDLSAATHATHNALQGRLSLERGNGNGSISPELLALGNAFLEQGDVSRALQAWGVNVALDRQGNLDLAKLAWARNVPVEHALTVAAQFLRDGKYHTAKTIFEAMKRIAPDRAVEIDTHMRIAYRSSGQVQIEHGLLADGMAMFREIKEDAPKEALELGAASAARDGRFDAFIEAYTRAHAGEDIDGNPSFQELLIECGQVCADKGNLVSLQKTYKRIGRDVPAILLKSCGDACIKLKRESDACKAYTEAGATQQLLLLAREWAQNPNKPVSLLCDAFSGALAHEELIGLAQKYIDLQLFSGACELLSAARKSPNSSVVAQATPLLIAAAESSAKWGSLDELCKVMKELGMESRLIELARTRLEEGKLDDAKQLYKEAGEKLPKDQLAIIAGKWLKLSKESYALYQQMPVGRAKDDALKAHIAQKAVADEYFDALTEEDAPSVLPEEHLS